MYNDNCIRSTATSIEAVDVESFLTQIQGWQQSLDYSRSYDNCIVGTLDGVLDIFFDCCSFAKI